jgi:hypothetical protein
VKITCVFRNEGGTSEVSLEPGDFSREPEGLRSVIRDHCVKGVDSRHLREDDRGRHTESVLGPAIRGGVFPRRTLW